ncbi:TadE/TadG family type IV pilus assembly protein [Solirhodobacter olei]|uniref:TadE/TadG family type IV pilus assembly protein n=1 Tax=Solirhodobacter olei TaxID=2493082 RepID=UPI001F4E8CEF|nr:TadE/TadG family type IV pilus assembly protein [Solirhodobacter olei]
MARMMRKFIEDTRGTIMVFWAMSLVVIIGLVALSFDIGRIASTRAQLQSFADNVALAAAGELDGGSDAITRATTAADTMISGSQTFGNGSHSLSGSADFSIAFYATLPANDTSPLGATTTDPAKAQYVSVTATPRSIGLTFAAALYQLLGQPVPKVLTQATAVAGFTQYACDITPMMMCLPHNTDAEGNPIPYRAEDNVGKMILMRAGGQGAAWGPGDFGFLDPSASDIAADPNGPCAGLPTTGEKYSECLLAAEGSVSQCFRQRGVTTQPGQANGINNAVMNVRFDIYLATLNHANKDPNYPAAPNVIKGIIPQGTGQTCIGQNAQVSPNTEALPNDTCLNNGSCTQPGGNGRFGNGIWDSPGYITQNWGGTAPPGWNGVTRWSLYNAEIKSADPPNGPSILTDKAETGRPICSQYQSQYPERRLIVVAGVDCTANPINGTSTVPVQEFFKIFLTRPVGPDPTTPSKEDIFGEIVGPAQGYGGAGGKGGLFHDVVQLYR